MSPTNDSRAHTTEISTPSDREVRTVRVFDAPRARVWRAYTDPDLVARWWGRGNRLVVERMEVARGGHWRFVEHAADGVHGFEGRFRDVTPPERIVQTFEWDAMPGHVVLSTTTFEELEDRTRVTVVSQFLTTEERDGMLRSGMEQGLSQSYAALDAVLSTPDAGEAAAPSIDVKKVAFTMVPISDVKRARAFYERVLGLTVGKAGGRGDMHWVEYDLPNGGCIALTNTTGAKPSDVAGATVALEVRDLASAMSDLQSKGVHFKSQVIRGPHCRMAVCLDSEGNALLLHQLDADR